MNKRNVKRHLIDRSIDLLLDPRLPHATLYNLGRLWRYEHPKQRPELNEPLRVCVTFDIEHDYRNPTSAAASQRFLAKYSGWARDRGWRSTLYVQGDQVLPLADLLHQVGSDHEIGLHGLHHEVWGRSRWWQYRLGFVGLSQAEKHERLQDSLALFRHAQLPRPRAFRAPYLNADHDTLTLLNKFGFTSDSSAATYLGAIPVPQCFDRIWKIPVTANPRPVWQGKLVHYPDLTMGHLVSMSKAELKAMITLALHLQAQHKHRLPPHIVLLAHPWEFESTPGVGHASEDNWKRLAQIGDMIAEIYPMRFITISELITQQVEHA